MSSLLRNLLIALGITLVLGLLYTVLFKGEESEDTAESPVETTDVSLKTEEILADINQINSYDLVGNSVIFNDPRFLSLTDSREDLGEVSTGRENPFEPIQ